MRNAQQFIVNGEPVAKGRPKFAKGRVYTPLRTVMGEQAIKQAAESAGVEMLHGAVTLHVKAYFKAPNSWSAKRLEYAECGDIRPTKRPDVDNILKLVSDALNGVCWEDDKQIVTAAIEKFYSQFPRVEISYWSASGIIVEPVK